MSASNNTRNSRASLILFIGVSLVLVIAAGVLLLGSKHSPHVGVASARILAAIDAVFKSALPTPWFRWFALWSVAGAALSVIIGLVILPRPTEAPSNFQRSTIATAELMRIVVIVVAVGASFFDFITAPKDPPATVSRRASAAKTTDAGQSKVDRDVASAVKGEGPPQATTPEQQIAVATSDSEPSSTGVEGQTQSLSAKGAPAPQAPAQAQPSSSDSYATGSASQSRQPGEQAPQGENKGARETASVSTQGATGAQKHSATHSAPDDMALADDLLPWEKSPRDGKTGGNYSEGRPEWTKSPYQDGGQGSARRRGRSRDSGNEGGYDHGSQAASLDPHDERDQNRRRPGRCDFVRGRFYNVKGRKNPDYEATIEIMTKGRGLIRLMTREGDVLLMDARVTSCNGDTITVLGSNGRTEAGVAYDRYREDVFVAPTSRRPREDRRK
jgi:hypothetical protein